MRSILPTLYRFITCLLIISASNIRAQVCHTFDPNHIDSIVAQEQSRKTVATDAIGLAPTANYDVVYHRLEVYLDPAVRNINGSVTTYFKPIDTLSSLAFDLTDSLRVTSVLYHQVSVPFSHNNNALLINLPSTVSRLDSLSILYQGVPPATGFGSFNLDLHDSIPVLWTLSEPYGARDWWPCKMTLLDKIDSLDTYISMPKGNRAASNGLLVDTVGTANTVMYHWRHRYPIATYLVGIAVTNYDTFSHIAPTVGGDVLVQDYVYPEHKAEWLQSKSDVEKFIALYSRVYGSYPFGKEKYGQAQFNWGGGMEHQTMSFILNSNFELMNREMAHQWFGDKLTCGSWSDIWLNEGFATFSSGLCYQYIATDYWYAWRRTTLDNIINKGGAGTVSCDDTTSVPRVFSSPLSYKKGAYLLHMLRWVLGDSDFFAALRDYVADPALSYSFTRTALLKQHMEQRSGRDLNTFFEQWFYTGGYPSYQLDWAQQGSAVSFKLSQTRTDATVSFFAMPVPVKCYGRWGDTTIVLDNTNSGQEYSFAIPFGIDSVVIDPELWLISAHNTVRKLPVIDRENFIRIYPDPISDVFTIWFDSENINKLSYALYNVQGQKVLSNEIQAQTDYYTGSLAGISAGVYVIKVTSNKGTYTQRILKD
jgi:aminopeptidase N